MLSFLVAAWWRGPSPQTDWEPSDWELPASWSVLNIEGGTVQEVFALGTDTVVAAAWPNLWVSVDGGASWQELHYILFGTEHGTADAFYNTILLFRDDSVIEVSQDLGQSWDTVYYTPRLVSARFTKSPFPTGLIYLVGIDTSGLDSLKVYRSSDGGITWTYINASETNLKKIFEVTYAPTRPTRLLLSGVTQSDSTVLLFTANSGGNWGVFLSAPSDTVKRFHAAFHPTDQNTVFVAAVSNDVLGNGSWLRASSDGGATWTTLDTNCVVNGLWVDNNYLYVGYSIPEGLKYFSLSDWTDTGWGYQGEAVLAGAGDGSNLYLATGGVGVLKGSLGSFFEVNSGLRAVWSQSPFGLAAVGDTLFVLDATSGRLYRSTDGGATWERLSLNMVYDAYEGWPLAFSVEVLGSKVWVAGFSLSVSPPGLFTLFMSDDGGESWRTQSLPFAPLMVNLDAVDADTLYAYGTLFEYGSGVYKSTDGGVSWTNVLSYPFRLFSGFIPWPHVAVKAADEVYFVDTAGVRLSTDGGNTWEYLPEYPFPVWRTAPTDTYLFASVTDLDESSIDSAGIWAWNGTAWQQVLLVPTMRLVFVPPDVAAKTEGAKRALAWTSVEGGLYGVVAYRDQENDWLYDTILGIMPASVNIVQDTCLVVGSFGGPWLKACGTFTGLKESFGRPGLRAWVSGRTLKVLAPKGEKLAVRLYDVAGRLAGSW